MRLFFLIKALAVAGGGAERVLVDVTAGLAQRGHQVTVASYDPPGSTDFYPVDPAVRRLRLGLGDGARPARFLETLRRMRTLRHLVCAEKPDAAVAFMHSSYLPLGLALWGSGVPVIGSEHIVFDHYRTRPLQAALLQLAPAVLAAMTAISERGRASFPARLQSIMTVIPNPVSVLPTERADVVGGRNKTVLTVGRMAEQKDQATLIAAFALLAHRFPEWNLRIVGDGSLRPHLERQVAELGLQGRVQFPGTSSQIGCEYSAAQLFALSSVYESFGLVTAEALAHGLPAIGFADCPGTNELIVDGRNGILVEPGSDRAGAFANGLERLIADEALRRRMASEAPASVSEFEPARIVDQWEQLLRSVTRRVHGGDP